MEPKEIRTRCQGKVGSFYWGTGGGVKDGHQWGYGVKEMTFGWEGTGEPIFPVREARIEPYLREEVLSEN